ncbi:expressed unknown protein [Seminavis robusta]|uniref:Methyltransferase domain-containing protein n=1 Tax=Seminavis robusta TaxID=568900 RepID=A0A9N8DWG9_9STRA|nr:expressed unknown protein [Seminavis robusta]|eukprot:Sro347_g122960.1 n/a (251) ;mRNA; f:35922-36674
MPVKTDEKKQHFDDIYVATTPVPYKTEILDKLEYISDDNNRQVFDRLILPWVQQQQGKLNYVDLCACFGNTTMATVCGMTYKQICDNWKDEDSCMTIQEKRRFDCHTTAIDISANAMAYCKKTGLFDEAIVVDLNDSSLEEEQKQVQAAMANADIFLSTAALVYLDLETIERIVQAFASKPTEGYMLVNFLNPFSLEKADETKRVLVKHLDFVGSMAARHRRMSPLEQENYPGETWALLELWVLRRKPKA